MPSTRLGRSPESAARGRLFERVREALRRRPAAERPAGAGARRADGGGDLRHVRAALRAAARVSTDRQA
jgi:hypothetical protein